MLDLREKMLQNLQEKALYKGTRPGGEEGSFKYTRRSRLRRADAFRGPFDLLQCGPLAGMRGSIT